MLFMQAANNDLLRQQYRKLSEVELTLNITCTLVLNVHIPIVRL